MKDKEIKALTVRKAKALLAKCVWRRCWYGRLVHCFTRFSAPSRRWKDGTTLCGKALTVYRHGFSSSYTQCPACTRKYRLLQLRAGESSQHE